MTMRSEAPDLAGASNQEFISGALNDDSDLARESLGADERLGAGRAQPVDLVNLFNRTERVLAQVRGAGFAVFALLPLCPQ